MRTLITLVLIFSAPILAAKDSHVIDPLEKDIASNDFSLIDELTQNKESLTKFVNQEQYFKERKKRWSPTAFRALLLKGTLLVNIKTEQTYTTSSDLYVLAQEKTLGSQITYILDKDKKIKYKTYTKNVHSIEQDIELYPTVDPNKVYTEKLKYHSMDKVLKIESHLSFQVETIKNNYFPELYEGEETFSYANRFQSKTYYNSLLPVDFGLSFGYQEGLWDQTDNQVKWTTLYFGPTLRWQFSKWKKFDFNTKLGVEKSLNFEAQGVSSSSQFSSLLYEWELEVVYNSGVGPFLFGWTYRNMSWLLKGSDTSLNTVNNKSSVISTGLFAGYRVDIDF